MPQITTLCWLEDTIQCMLMMLQLLFCNKLNKIVKQLVLNITNKLETKLTLADPELGTAQPQLVVFFITSVLFKWLKG